MKKVLLLTLVVLLGAGQAYAAGGSIGIFSNSSANNCNISDSFGLIAVPVVHTLSDGSTAVDLSAPVPPCSGWTPVGEAKNFGGLGQPGVYFGDTWTGANVAYGSCLSVSPSSPVVVAHLTTINMFGQLLAAPCCPYTVMNHPTTGDPTPISVNCGPIQERVKQVASGGTGIINAQLGCQCNVPNQESTWGQIKDLYR